MVVLFSTKYLYFLYFDVLSNAPYPFIPLRLSEAYVFRLIMPPLVQIMTCRLFGAKEISEIMLASCYLDLKKISGISIKRENFARKEVIFVYIVRSKPKHRSTFVIPVRYKAPYSMTPCLNDSL